MTFTEQQAKWFNDVEGELNKTDGIECAICKNRGYINVAKDERLYMLECSCMKRRKVVRNAKNSNAEHLLKLFNFDNYETPSDLQKKIKEKAQAFCEKDSGAWYIGGSIGSGKTHICVAMLNKLLDKGKECRYYIWSDLATALNKAMIDSEREYYRMLDELETIPVLYIDDFFRETPSKAEIKLAFNIINKRYMAQLGDKKLYTLVSSQNSISELLAVDEAIASRLWEMATKEYLLTIPKGNNWRTR